MTTQNIQIAQIQEVHLTKTQFKKDLKICLEILQTPTTKHPYYICRYTSAALYTRLYKVFV